MGYYTDVITDLQWAVMGIQRNGILIDQDLVKSYFNLANQKQEELGDWFNAALGYEFNPNSPKQVLELFNKDFHIPITDSADRLGMRKLQIKYPEIAPIVSGILDYRDLGKKRGTYLKPEPWSDGRVRSQFRTYGTLTWRLSSREPDLQNLPRSSTYGINIKNIYRAAKDYKLVEIDKSQLELRIPAYASRCLKLIEWFDSRRDIYLETARFIYNRPELDKKSTERQFTKRAMLADGYGASAERVSDTMLLDTGEYLAPSIMQTHLDKIRATKPEVYEWHNRNWDYAKTHKILYDGFGTPRLLYDRPDNLRQTAYSWPTQATASGVVNRALVRIYKWIQKERLQDLVRIICQVHDSLLFEIHDSVIKNTVPALISLMDQSETIFDYSVVLPSEAKWGERWGDMEGWC